MKKSKSILIGIFIPLLYSIIMHPLLYMGYNERLAVIQNALLYVLPSLPGIFCAMWFVKDSLKDFFKTWGICFITSVCFVLLYTFLRIDLLIFRLVTGSKEFALGEGFLMAITWVAYISSCFFGTVIAGVVSFIRQKRKPALLGTTANELKEQLNKEYPYRIELHAHTKPQSSCSEILPEELAETYKNMGYDGLVVTNHFMGYNLHKDGEYMEGETKEERLKYYLAGYKETKEAGDKIGIKVYLGLEIRFSKENENDYLIYGVDDEIVSICYDNFRGTLAEFREKVALPESVFVQAHPFRNGMEQVNSELLDGTETFNMHPGHNASIGIAVRHAKENNLKIKTVGSDYHHKNRGHEGVSALRTKVLPEDSFELAQILKSGDYIFEIGGEALVLP